VTGTIIFVLAFILLGLGVVGLAMRSGPRRKAKGAQDPSRSERRATLAATAAITLGIGLIVPGIVVVANSEDKAKDAPGGVDLTSAQAEGRQLFARNCGNCHTLGASNSVGRVGPNLDQLRPPAQLTLDAIEKGRARGLGQMPAELLSGEEAENVAAYVEAVAGRG